MSYEGQFPLQHYFDGDAYDQFQDKVKAQREHELEFGHPDYEYCVQWYHPHGVDSWIKTGWHGDRWTTIKDARHEYENLLSGIHTKDDARIVKRRKPGPIEVVDLD